MSAEQYAKSHLSGAQPVEGKIEIDLSTVPQHRLVPFFKALQREVLKYKAEREAAGTLAAAEGEGES